MNKCVLGILFFLMSINTSFGQGPIMKKTGSAHGKGKTTVVVNDLATSNDSIQIVNGRKVYIDKNGVQSLQQVK
ncbi:MAG: hypothetical protein ACKOX3_08865 [Bacteroidota bacterium]